MEQTRQGDVVSAVVVRKQRREASASESHESSREASRIVESAAVSLLTHPRKLIA